MPPLPTGNSRTINPLTSSPIYSTTTTSSTTTVYHSTTTPSLKNNPPTTDSGIKGTVTIGPSCPVAQNPPQPGCEDKPYSTSFKLINSSGKVISQFSSDQNGKFSVVVPQGKYEIKWGLSAKMPTMTSSGVITVLSHAFTQIKLQFDSGIR